MDDKKKKLDDLVKKMNETRKSWNKKKLLESKERPKEVIKESTITKIDNLNNDKKEKKSVLKNLNNTFKSNNYTKKNTESINDDDSEGVSKKAIKAIIVGKMLDEIPGAETTYDVYNTLTNLKKGDVIGAGSNFIGSLIPGFSGKAIEAVADEYIPKQNESSMKAARTALNISPGDAIKYLNKYGPGYANNPEFIKNEGSEFAYGGNLQQQNNNNMLTEFNKGGSHESNPLGGIPQGQSANGQMNTVEQGETKKGSYVYSDRLYINEDLAKAMNLPGYIKGKTFASASKAISDKFKDRNDPHTKATQKELLDRLTGAQEQLKAEQDAINQSMQSNQSETEYPQEQQQFYGGGFLGQNFSMEDSPLNTEVEDTPPSAQPSPFGSFLNKNAAGISTAAGMAGNSLYSQDAKKGANLDNINKVAGTIGGPIGRYAKVATGAYDAGSEIFGKSDIDTSGNMIQPGVDSGKAAAKGALSGAAAGMAFGPMGAGIGAVVGGAAGLVGANKDKKAVAKNNETFYRKDNFYKYQFDENNNDTKVYAEGGDLGIDPPVKSNYTPTRQDSLSVLNRSIENEKAYLDKGYKMTNSYAVKPDLYDNMLKKGNQIADKQRRNQPTNLIQNGVMTPGVLDASKYRRDLGNGNFESRELADNYLNMDVKPSLFNQNINPTLQKVFTSPDGKDLVSIPSYNSSAFTNSLNRPQTQLASQTIQQNVVPQSGVKTPITAPVTRTQVSKLDKRPVADTLQTQNYGVGTNQKFKTTKLAQKALLPSNKAQSNFDSFMAGRTNQKAYGGPLDEVNPGDTFPNGIYKAPEVTDQQYLANNKGMYNPDIVKEIQKRTGASIDGIPGKETYLKAGLRPDGTMVPIRLNAEQALNSAMSTPDAPNGYSLQDVQGMESKYNTSQLPGEQTSSTGAKGNILNKYRNSATDALRYAPILGNMFQKNSIGQAEVESAMKNPYQYKKQYIDEAQYRNASDQQSALSMDALNKSGLSGNQLMAASLGSQLQRTKGVAEGAMAAKMNNLNEDKIGEQVKQQNEGDYITEQRRIKDINAQNRANRDTQISKFDSEIANSLGEIGKEGVFKQQAEKLTGYKWMGDYLMSDPNYKSQYDAIANDNTLNDNQKYAKQQDLMNKKFAGMTAEELAYAKAQADELSTRNLPKAYGGYLNTQFKKY